MLSDYFIQRRAQPPVTATAGEGNLNRQVASYVQCISNFKFRHDTHGGWYWCKSGQVNFLRWIFNAPPVPGWMECLLSQHTLVRVWLCNRLGSLMKKVYSSFHNTKSDNLVILFPELGASHPRTCMPSLAAPARPPASAAWNIRWCQLCTLRFALRLRDWSC